MLYTFALILFPCIPLIAETVDRKWFRFYITKYYFSINNEGFEGFLPKKARSITLESVQATFRNDMFKYRFGMIHFLCTGSSNDWAEELCVRPVFCPMASNSNGNE
jgi:hypothetical protein